jgi:hypothetical protein
MDSTTKDTTCTHTLRPVTADIEVAACASCRSIDWFRQGTSIPAFDGMAAVFGAFDLVATLPGVSAPGPDVHLYKVPRSASRSLLGSLPVRTWLEAAPGLAIAHDGRHLLVSPMHSLTFDSSPA